MKFHNPTEVGKWLVRLTAAEVFYTYALENQKKLQMEWDKKGQLGRKKRSTWQKKGQLGK